MDDLKKNFSEQAGKLAELETAARKLQNQNLADVAMLAKGRVQQLADHPDLHLLQEGDGSNVTGRDLYNKKVGAGANWDALSDADKAVWDKQAADAKVKPTTFDPSAGRTAATGKQIYDREFGANANWDALPQPVKDRYDDRARIENQPVKDRYDDRARIENQPYDGSSSVGGQPYVPQQQR